MTEYHKSVLLDETIEQLEIHKDGLYIDGTLGGGGHTQEILKRGGKVLGIDQDADAIGYVGQQFEHEIAGEKLRIVNANFNKIEEIAKKNDFTKVDGVLLDIGISSHHVDTPERGFSFLRPGPLDMRMDVSLSVTAADLVNGLTRSELIELFTKYGEEPFAKRIANAISEERTKKRIETTLDLAALIARSVPKKADGPHPATRVFQALRIAVNDELHSLEEGLAGAVSVLKKNGRLAVITFHSLEDRIVKDAFKQLEADGIGIIITQTPITPSEEEVEVNRRSRSAKLRVFEKQ